MSEELPQEIEEQSDDTMFRDAVDALRRGDKPRAKELLTLLLKADQNNPTYWVWLSASVDNAKERIYCLQTALKLDPENGTAKRGLILLGALKPDETIQPFPMNHPRGWEQKLLLATDKPKEKGFTAFTKSPVVRLMGIVLVGASLCAVVVFGFILPRQTNVQRRPTNTPGPSPTFTATPTVFGAAAAPTSFSIGPTPLWMLLPQTYTPTPLYVNTPRPPQSIDQFRQAKAAYEKKDWDGFIQNMELIAAGEPNSADVQYYIGEAYRFKGEANNAIKAYNNALKINPDFGPAYLGLARARLMDDPGLNVEFLFDEAIARDPNFGEIYLERAYYFINNKNYDAAILDLDRANQIIPESPVVYLGYANAYLGLGEKDKAIEAGEKAYSLDITMLPVYQLLGKLYIENGQYQRAIEALELYVVYEPEDATAFAMIGQAYFEQKNYEMTVSSLNKAYKLNPSGLRKYYVYRGLANLELDNVDKAVEDLERAYDYEDSSFEVNLGLLKAYYIQEKFGTAFLKAETIKSLAKTEQEAAIALYWRALIQEKRAETKDAIKSWQELLAMDANLMSPEMRADAESHLKTMVTPTNTPKSGTATSTPKAAGSITGTATPKASSATAPVATKTPTTP